MRTLLIGVDSGTQSTKALVVDAKTGRVLGSSSEAYDLIPRLPPGAKEQHPKTWRDATSKAIRELFLERGLATIERGRLRMPDYGRPYARVIASLFDTYRQPAARRFSSAI